MVKTPRKVHPGVSEKPSGDNTAGESEYFSEKSPAAVYSNVLCAVIEDFQVINNRDAVYYFYDMRYVVSAIIYSYNYEEHAIFK